MRKSNGVPTMTSTSAFAQRLSARSVEVMRVARRQQPAAGAVEVSRNIQTAQQRDRLVLTARGPDLLSVQNRRPLCIDKDVGQFLDVARVSDRARRRTILARLGNDRLPRGRPSRSSTSRGISRYAGPGAPLKASRTAIETMSRDNRSVLDTVAANLVMGVMPSTCGRSAAIPSCAASARPAPRCAARTFGAERGGDAGNRVRESRPGGVTTQPSLPVWRA